MSPALIQATSIFPRTTAQRRVTVPVDSQSFDSQGMLKDHGNDGAELLGADFQLQEEGEEEEGEEGEKNVCVLRTQHKAEPRGSHFLLVNK